MNSTYTLLKTVLRLAAILIFVFVEANAAPTFNPRVRFFRSQLEDSTLTRSSRIEYYDSLLATNPADRASLLFHKAVALRLNGNMMQALQAYRDAYSCGVMLDETDRLECLYAIGSLLNEIGKPVDAISEVMRLMAVPKSDSLKYYDVKALMTVGNVQMMLGNADGALKAAVSGLNLLNKIKNMTPSPVYRVLSGALLISKGGANAWLKNYNEALDDYSAAGKMLDKTYQGMLNLNLGVLFSEMNQHDIAQSYYLKAMEDEWLGPKNKSSAVVNHVVNLVDLKKYDAALEAVEKYKEELTPIYGTPDEYKLWSIISEAYESKREWQKALEYRNKSVALKDSLLSNEVRDSIDKTLNEIETFSARNDNNEGGRPESRNQLLPWILVGIFALVAVVFFRRYRGMRKRENARLEVAEKERSQLVASREERDQMSQELSVCKARLSHITGSLGELKRMVANPRTHKAEIVSAVESATRSISSDASVWEPLMAYAEGASPAFFDKLYRLHPDLTNSEKRMCAFILMSRTTKEIATILNRSPRTVESIKYSLRAKLRVKDMTTEQYLRKISSTPLDQLESTLQTSNPRPVQS